MPKPTPAQAEHQRLLKPLLYFLSNLPTRLENLYPPPSTSPTAPSRPATDAASLLSELQSHINTLRSANAPALFASDLAGSKPHDLDRKATALWNLGTRLKREFEDAGSIVPSAKSRADAVPELQVLALLRVFLFLVLDAAAAASRASAKSNRDPDRVRLMRVAIKAARSCLELGWLEFCTKVLERAADHEDALAKVVAQNGHGQDGVAMVYPALRGEFFVLRMTLAWKQDNLQLAEMMRAQAAGNDAWPLDASGVEALADALFEIGKALFCKDEFYQASKWLEKAYDTISSQELDRLSPDASELKLSILHYLVRAQLGLNNDEARDKARNVLALMENESTERIVVSFLRLDIINSESEFDAEQYYLVLNRIMRMMHLTDPIFKTAMSHVNKLKEHNPELACKALDDFLNLRLYANEKEKWVHRCFITRLWITVDKLPNESGALEALQQCFASMAENSRATLTEKATHAAQTLIWKRIDFLFRQQQYAEADLWCRLALHSIFSNAGEINTAKINRKILLCQINRRDYAGARATFNQMTESARAAPMTRHIMYKLAIRDQDATLAAECIEDICRAPSKDATLLYACVVEAYSSGNKHQAIIALQKVLDKYQYGAPDELHLPSLIRCTAKLLVSEIPENTTEDSNIPEEICKLFDGAVAAIRRPTPKTDEANSFDGKELDWFVTNSYNLALKYFGQWRPNIVVRLLESCILFSESRDYQNLVNGHVSRQDHVAVAHALAAQQLLQLARTEDNQASQLQCYLRVRKHIKAFREAFKPTEASNDQAIRANMNNISRKLSLSDFEAAIHLKTWDDLTKILDDCKCADSSENFQVYADMLMASDAPPPVILHTLEHMTMTTTTITNDQAEPAALALQARWLRILHHLSLTHPQPPPPPPHQAASKTPQTKPDTIIARALSLARHARGTSASPSHSYPPEELEYLATTTFNRAVDAYCVADEGACRRLGEQALELARELELCVGGDKGRLKAVLMSRLVGLGFEDGHGGGV